MPDTDVETTERLLVKTRKICRLIGLAMIVVFVFLCIWWLASSGVMVCSLFDPGFSDNPVNGFTLVNYVLCGMLQVKRLRLIAISLLAYGVLEFVMTCSAAFMNQGWAGSSAGSVSPTLNFFPLVAAAVVFAFSFVFKYGILLQKLSDETL